MIEGVEKDGFFWRWNEDNKEWLIDVGGSGGSPSIFDPPPNPPSKSIEEYNMTLEKVADIPVPCTHPEHNPPNMIVLEPGIYKHTCPGCGEITTFTVPHKGIM